LLEHNFEVRAVSRHAERAELLFGSNCPGLAVMKGDVNDDAAVIATLAGAYGAVNAVSLYVERGRETFEAVHVEAAASVAILAGEAGVKRLVHISGIGADPASASSYISARGRGEEAVQRAFPDAILIRPSVMFGLDDAFLTRLAKLVRLLPVFPMFGRGRTKLQPVFVEDVAEATSRLMEHQGAVDPCYELGGPRAYSYEELVRTLALRTGARTKILPMPFAFWHALAWFAEHLPSSPLTRNQVSLMRSHNVASLNFPGLPELAIDPTPIETFVPAVDYRNGRVQP
jgi:NADH dehydrogenase